MGNISLAAQQKALDEGGTAIAVPGTAFAAQGQRYSEAAGQTPEKFQSRISATKPARGSGEGYVGDVAGVVSEGKFLGMDTKTFTGRTGFTPSGEKIDEPRGGGGATKLAEAPPTEPEIVPEVTPEVVPDDTVLSSKTRRTRSKRSGAGGTLIEGYGVLTAQEIIMSFLTPKAPPPPPPPPPPEPISAEKSARAAALSEEALMKERRKRKGAGSTIVAGALGEQVTTTGKPTLLG